MIAGGLLSLRDHARGYYALVLLATSVTAAGGGALQILATGGGSAEMAAGAGGAGLLAASVTLVISHHAWEMWRVERLKSITAATALIQAAPVEDTRPAPEPDRFLTTRAGNVFDRVTGVLSIKDKRKRKYASEVVDVIGRYVIETPGGDDQVIMVDVSLGWWRLARYWRDGVSTAEAEWCGNGKPFTKPEYRALRHWIISERLGYWRNARVPNQGWELTHRARALLRGEAQREKPAPPRRVKIDDKKLVAYVRAHATHE